MNRSLPAAALGKRAGLAGDAAFLGASAVLWLVCAVVTISLCRSMSGGMPMPGGWIMSMAWMRMPGQTWLGAAASFLGMWIVMMAAMMMPSLAAMLSSYRRGMRESEQTPPASRTAMAATGYFFVWTVFGAAAYVFAVALTAAEMRWPALARCVPIATGIVLLLAGGLQLTAWKARQLARCRDASACGRAPSSDALGACRHGLRLGVHCGLCCSGFMMILLAIGVMDLVAMVLVACAITVERLAPSPVRTARTTGVLVAAAGLFVIVRALGVV